MKVHIEKSYEILCYYCESEHLLEINKQSVLKQAKELGWRIHKGENICPKCLKQLKG